MLRDTLWQHSRGMYWSHGAGLYACLVLSVGWLLVVVLRLTGPCDLADNAQYRQASYAIDVYYRGNWLFQREFHGAFQSKPPLYNWLAACVARVRGRMDVVSLYSPSALAMLAMVLTAGWLAGKMKRSELLCLVAGTAVLANPLGVKLSWLARTDTLFAALTWVGLLLTLRSLSSPRCWILAWIVLGLATLTKGPLCLLFVGIGLVGLGSSRSLFRAARQPALWVGVGLYLIMTVGWLLTATWVAGPGLARTLLGRELAQHALFGVEWRPPFWNFYKPPLSFLSRMFPWSLLALGAFITARRRARCSRLERVLLAYVFGGLAALMVSPHHRGDHLAPFLPAAAVLAAVELYRLTERFSLRPVARLCAPAALTVALILGYVHYHIVRASDPAVRLTAKLQEIARELARSDRESPVYTPYVTSVLDFFLRAEGHTKGALWGQPSGTIDGPAYVVTLRPDLVEPALGEGWLRRDDYGEERLEFGHLVVYERVDPRVANGRRESLRVR